MFFNDSFQDEEPLIHFVAGPDLTQHKLVLFREV
jgi:hypothetical protein